MERTETQQPALTKEEVQEMIAAAREELQQRRWEMVCDVDREPRPQIREAARDVGMER